MYKINNGIDDNDWKFNFQQLKQQQKQSNENENHLKIIYQISLPLLIAGLGMVAAGIFIDHIKTSIVFMSIPEIYILLPALLGLKGNIEMTMTSRLSSLANCGQLNQKNRQQIFQSNIALVLCQSIVIGFAAALFAIIVNLIQLISSNYFYDDDVNQFYPHYKLSTEIFKNINHIPMLCATSIITASLTSLLLATIMITVICYSIKFNINPDNVATPIAAALGDLVTLIILYSISNLFYLLMDNYKYLLILIIICSLLSIKLYLNEIYKHSSTKLSLSLNCWIPMIIAMFISSLSGTILSYSIKYFNNIILYQPLVNGFGGNIASIQSSRLSSYLYLIKNNDDDVKLKNNKSLIIKQFYRKNLFTFFLGKDQHSISTQSLLSIVIPFHLLFFLLLNQINHDNQQIFNIKNFLIFLSIYLLLTFIQVFLLLFMTNIIVINLWLYKHNPDDSSIPFITSLGDLFGTILLTITFYLYHYLSL